MQRNYDEVISDMLIQLAQIERNLEKENRGVLKIQFPFIISPLGKQE